MQNLEKPKFSVQLVCDGEMNQHLVSLQRLLLSFGIPFPLFAALSLGGRAVER